MAVHNQLQTRQRHGIVLTNLNHDLAKVIGMPTPLEESNIADCTGLFTWTLLEPVFLNVAYGFHGEGDCEYYHGDDVCGFSETRLRILQHIRRVDDGDGKTDDPTPQHLRDPESEKREELVPLVVETIVGSGFQDAEEEKPGKTGAPEHDEYTDYNIAGVGGSRESEGKNCKPDEVCAAWESQWYVQNEQCRRSYP